MVEGAAGGLQDTAGIADLKEAVKAGWQQAQQLPLWGRSPEFMLTNQSSSMKLHSINLKSAKERIKETSK